MNDHLDRNCIVDSIKPSEVSWDEGPSTESLTLTEKKRPRVEETVGAFLNPKSAKKPLAKRETFQSSDENIANTNVPNRAHCQPFSQSSESSALTHFLISSDASSLAAKIAAKTGGSCQTDSLNPNGTSWYLLARSCTPSQSCLPRFSRAFEDQWSLRPEEFKKVRMGFEKRYSQSWGYSYKYSGLVNAAHPLAENLLIVDLVNFANEVVDPVKQPYNGCLQVFEIIRKYFQ